MRQLLFLIILLLQAKQNICLFLLNFFSGWIVQDREGAATVVLTILLLLVEAQDEHGHYMIGSKSEPKEGTFFVHRKNSKFFDLVVSDT